MHINYSNPENWTGKDFFSAYVSKFVKCAFSQMIITVISKIHLCKEKQEKLHLFFLNFEGGLLTKLYCHYNFVFMPGTSTPW